MTSLKQIFNDNDLHKGLLGSDSTVFKILEKSVNSIPFLEPS